MSKKRLYKVGIIGCGRIAGFLENDLLRDHPCTHAGTYRQHPKTELVACASRNKANLMRFADQFQIPHQYTDYREMLNNHSLDIVSVCTPAFSHADIVSDIALSSGVAAIFCEKAIASSLAQAEKMIRVCKKRNIKLTINHTRRWTWELNMIKRLILRGDIGQLQTINGSFGGNLIHTGTHFFDILSFLCGNPKWAYGSVTGMKNNFLKNYAYPDIEKIDFITDYDGYGVIGFENNVVANVCGQAKEYFLFELDIWGSRGRIRFGNNGVLEFYKKAKSPHYVGFLELKKYPFPEPKKIVNGWFVAIDDIIRSMEQDCDTLSSALEASKALELALGVYLSHLSRQKILFPLKGNFKKIKIISK